MRVAVFVVVCCVFGGGGCLDRYLDPPEARSSTVALFDPARGVLPFPHDALLLGSGTVSVPVDDDAPASDPRRALNTLNGFGLTGVVRIPFSRGLDAASVVYGDTVRVFDGFAGDEFDGGDVVVVIDDSGSALLVVPLVPWPEGATVVVIVTDDLKDEDGEFVDADAVFKVARSERALVDSDGHAVRQDLISDDDARALEPLRALTSLACTPARLRGVTDDALVMCLPFTVQHQSDRLRALDDVDAARHAAGDDELRVLSTPLFSTADLGADVFAGAADVFVGALRVGRFVPLDRPLDGAIGDTGDIVDDEIVPLIVTAPRGFVGSAGHGADGVDVERPAVVVFQHGVTRDRTDVLALADAFAAAGVVVVAADLPLHGLTGDSAHVFAAVNPVLDANSAASQSPRFDGLRPRERTLDLDVVDNDSGDPGPDARIDASGTHLLNLASLVTTRDTLLQAVVDVRAVGRAAAVLDVDGDGVSDVSGRVFFVGHSLGAIVGASACALDDDDDGAVFDGCVLVTPGAQVGRVLQTSPTFGPVMRQGLARAGVVDDADVDAFVAVAQIVLDGADPWLSAPRLAAQRAPLLVVDVTDDQVILNRVPFFPLAGGAPFVAALGLDDVDDDRRGDVAQRVHVRYARGAHGSLLSPTEPDVTASMQSLVAGFVASAGRVVDVDEALVGGP